jgi:hypothetical protein
MKLISTDCTYTRYIARSLQLASSNFFLAEFKLSNWMPYFSKTASPDLQHSFVCNEENRQKIQRTTARKQIVANDDQICITTCVSVSLRQRHSLAWSQWLSHIVCCTYELQRPVDCHSNSPFNMSGYRLVTSDLLRSSPNGQNYFRSDFYTVKMGNNLWKLRDRRKMSMKHK